MKANEKFSTTIITKKDVRRATVVAFFAWIFAVYDFILFGTLLPEIGRHYGWSVVQQAEVATYVSIGTAVIALAVGPMLDHLGRRSGLLWTVVGAAICSGLTVVGGSLGKGWLIAIRSLAGLGYAEETVNATYLNELYTAAKDPKLDRNKGFIYSLVQGGFPIGALVAAGLTAVLLPRIGWQGCFLFATFPAIVIILLTRGLKESPQFLALKEIKRLRKEGLEGEARNIARTHDLSIEGTKRVGIAAAFRGDSVRATLVLSIVFLLSWSPVQVFLVLGTTVLTQVHNVSFQSSLWMLTLSNVVGYCGYLCHGWMGDRIGRRNVIGIGWIISGFCFSWMLYGSSNTAVVLSLYSIGVFFLAGPFAAALFFIGESFPTEIRGTGSAVVHAMGPIGAILAGVGVTYVLSSGGNWMQAAFWLGSIPAVISGVLIFLTNPVARTSVNYVISEELK